MDRASCVHLTHLPLKYSKHPSLDYKPISKTTFPQDSDHGVSSTPNISLPKFIRTFYLHQSRKEGPIYIDIYMTYTNTYLSGLCMCEQKMPFPHFLSNDLNSTRAERVSIVLVK